MPNGAIQAPKPKSLGGWVVWAAIWMVAASLSQARVLWSAYAQRDAFLLASPLQQAGVLFSVAGTAILFVAMPIWILKLLTDRNRRFPTAYVAWAVAVPAFLAADVVMAYLLYKPLHDAGQMVLFNRGALTAVGGAVAGLIVWVPYMLRSRHVRETFSI